MDHLPQPHQAKGRARDFEIKCYCRADIIKDVDFDLYPQISGWKPRNDAEWFTIIEQKKDDFQGFLQEWLYFGTIRTFLQEELRVDTFVRLSDTYNGNWVLDTTQLPNLLNAWIDRASNSQSIGLVKPLAYMSQALNIHTHLREPSENNEEPDLRPRSNKVSLQDFLVDQTGWREPRDGGMVEAQSALLNLLNSAYNRVVELLPGEERSDIHATSRMQISCLEGGDLWNRMRRSGWCIADLSLLASCFSVSGFYFASFLDIPNVNHASCEAIQDWRENCRRSKIHPDPICKKRHCGFSQQDRNSYKTQHVDGCKGLCGDMLVDDARLLGILRLEGDQFPIVEGIDETCESFIISLIPYKGDHTYVAISHIWADGLGNGEKNGLPRCQMLRLSRLCKEQLPDGKRVLFWIDTLCIPSHTMHCDTEQIKAMNLMRRTYQKGRIVLVLDKRLLNKDLMNNPSLDGLFKVLCSQWTRRLWTLQEGAFTESLIIACRDKEKVGFFNVDSAVSSMKNEAVDARYLSLRNDILHRWYTIRAQATLSPKDFLYAIYPSLGFRTTGTLEDEALSLGVLFNFEITEIAKEEGQDGRMEKFWSMFDEVPISIIMLEERKLETDGFRWAPRSFMRDNESIVRNNRNQLMHSNPARRTERGLEFSTPGYIFAAGVYELPDRLLVYHPKGFWCACYIVPDAELIDPEIVTHKTRVLVPPEPRRLALIHHDYSDADDWKSPTSKTGIVGAIGWVSTIECVNGVIKRVEARRFGTFMLRKASREARDVQVADAQHTNFVNNGCSPDGFVLIEDGFIKAARLLELPNNQMWLFD